MQAATSALETGGALPVLVLGNSESFIRKDPGVSLGVNIITTFGPFAWLL